MTKSEMVREIRRALGPDWTTHTALDPVVGGGWLPAVLVAQRYTRHELMAVIDQTAPDLLVKRRDSRFVAALSYVLYLVLWAVSFTLIGVVRLVLAVSSLWPKTRIDWVGALIMVLLFVPLVIVSFAYVVVGLIALVLRRFPVRSVRRWAESLLFDMRRHTTQEPYAAPEPVLIEPERMDIESGRRVRVPGIPGTAIVIAVDEESRVAELRFDAGRTWLGGLYPFGRIEPIQDTDNGGER